MSLVKDKSKRQEKRTAKEFNGKTTLASGALASQKGDVRTGSRTIKFNDSDFLIENKYTDKDYYVFKKCIWDKIENEALKDNFRIALMQIDIQDLSLIAMSLNHFIVLYKDSISPETFKGTINVYKGSTRLNKSEILARKESCSSSDLLTIHYIFSGDKQQKHIVLMTKEDYFTLRD